MSVSYYIGYLTVKYLNLQLNSDFPSQHLVWKALVTSVATREKLEISYLIFVSKGKQVVLYMATATYWKIFWYISL